MIYLLVGRQNTVSPSLLRSYANDVHEQNLKNQKLIDFQVKLHPEKHVIRKIFTRTLMDMRKIAICRKSSSRLARVHLITLFVFMDEIHLRPEYTDSNGRMSQEQMIVDLTTHRTPKQRHLLNHQDPQRLNRGIR